jgi:hypothetical protein
VIYLLSVGFWSMFLIYAGESLNKRFFEIMAILMFIPVINTLISFFVVLTSWGQLLSGPGPKE